MSQLVIDKKMTLLRQSRAAHASHPFLPDQSVPWSLLKYLAALGLLRLLHFLMLTGGALSLPLDIKSVAQGWNHIQKERRDRADRSAGYLLGVASPFTSTYQSEPEMWAHALRTTFGRVPGHFSIISPGRIV